jgi:hypothetical protein
MNGGVSWLAPSAAVLDHHPAARADGGDHALERALVIGDVHDHRSRRCEVEGALRTRRPVLVASGVRELGGRDGGGPLDCQGLGQGRQPVVVDAAGLEVLDRSGGAASRKRSVMRAGAPHWGRGWARP